MAKLTKTKVDAFQCRSGSQQDFLWCGEQRGFGVRCTATGKKTFILRGRVKGTGAERFIRIGAYGKWTLAMAETQARKVLLQLDQGLDPRVETAKVDALKVTLRQVAHEYVATKRTKNGPLREASKADVLRHVDQNLGDWADKAISVITRDKCVQRFDKLSERSPSQANQCMVNLRALCNWAREKYATDDEYPLLPVNPVTRMFKIRRMNPEPPKTRRVPLEKVGAVWSMLRKRLAEGRTVEDRTAAGYVSFLLLTGARRGESSTLTWDRVNLDESWFEFPGALTKNHNPLRLPISGAMRTLLAAIPRRTGNPYVFATWSRKTGHISCPTATMEAVSEVAGLHLSPHDLRRTADDIAKVVRIGDDERRQLLNHLTNDVHGRHYANNPDPRALADAVNAMHAWIEGQALIVESKEVLELQGQVNVKCI